MYKQQLMLDHDYYLLELESDPSFDLKRMLERRIIPNTIVGKIQYTILETPNKTFQPLLTPILWEDYEDFTMDIVNEKHRFEDLSQRMLVYIQSDLIRAASWGFYGLNFDKLGEQTGVYLPGREEEDTLNTYFKRGVLGYIYSAIMAISKELHSRG